MVRKVMLLLALGSVLLFFLAFFFLPIFEILRGGFVDERGHVTLFYFAEFCRNPLYMEGLCNTFAIAVCTTLLALLAALPLAWLADRFDFPGKRWLTGALLLPLILPPFVGALGMQRVFGQFGSLNSLLAWLGFIRPAEAIDWLGTGGFMGVVLVEALHLYPILYLNAVAALANVDPVLNEAAANLGCVGFRRFRRITLPLVMPGIFAGGALVFIWSFTELGTPLMFNYERVTPVQIFNGIKEIGDSPMPYVLVTVMLAAAGLLYLLARFTVGRKAYAMMSKAGTAVRQVRLSGMRGWGVTLFFLALIGIAVLPHLGVIGISLAGAWYRTVLPSTLTLAHYQAALGHNLTVPSILNSVRYAAVATAVAMLFGVFVACVVVRTKLRGRWLIDSMSMLPLAVPGLVLAFGYLAMTQKGRVLNFLDPIENPTVLLIVAYAVRRLPYVVRAAVAGVQQTSVSFEEAAMNLGAGPWRTFRRITAPLISANLIAGGLLAFSFSMLEVSDSLILAQKSVYFPITKSIYELSMLLGQGQALAAALGVWTMVFLGAALLITSFLLGKRLGALFRV